MKPWLRDVLSKAGSLCLAAGFVLWLVLIPCEAGAAAVRDETPEVMSVLPPGQGENLVSEKEGVPPSLTSQLDMFRLLPGALNDLTASMLVQFYKPMDFAQVSRNEIQSVDRPIPGVTIVRDKTYEVPRVLGATRGDAMFGVGYAQAQSLLWQMEVNRHTWYGTLAALLGPGKDGENLSSDAIQFRVLDYSQDEYRAMYERLRTEHGYWGRQAYKDLQSYVDGINAYVDEIRSKSRPLPVEFQQRGLTPSRWAPVDVIASTAWSHVRGLWRGFGPREAGNAVLLRRLRDQFGEIGGDQVYADLRDAGDPETPRIVPSSRVSVPSRLETDPASVALLDAGSFVPRSALVSRDNAAVSAASQFISAPPSKSNALLVASAISATGHPLSIQGPQDKYGVPHNYDFEVQIVAPDLEARGSIEFHGPYPYNGARGRNFAFSGTAQYLDQFDMFAELLCEPNGSKPTPRSIHYLYRGRCIALEIRDRSQGLSGALGSYTLRSMRSVHGPIIGQATVNGQPVVLSQARSTLFHEEGGLAALAQVFAPSAVQSARTFIDVMARSPRQLGFYYIDRKDIAFVNPGLVPVRAVGMRPDLPAWGTGEWDWQNFDSKKYTFRSIPPSQLPSAINPPDHVLAGWNNLPGDQWPISDAMWIAGPGHRVSLLKDPVITLASQRPVSLVDLVRIHTLAGLTDARARFTYLIVRRVIVSKDLPADVKGIIGVLDDWVAAGALRVEAPERGVLEHGAAIAVFDSWWPVLLRAAFQPALGQQIMDEAGGKPNNLSPLTTGPGSVSGWIGLLSKDLRTLLGDNVPGRLSRVYCGRGNLNTCRSSLLTSLRTAMSNARTAFGDDFLVRSYPITCDRCVQTEFEVTGAAGSLKPIPWQNRPTFELITNFR